MITKSFIETPKLLVFRLLSYTSSDGREELKWILYISMIAVRIILNVHLWRVQTSCNITFTQGQIWPTSPTILHERAHSIWIVHNWQPARNQILQGCFDSILIPAVIHILKIPVKVITDQNVGSVHKLWNSWQQVYFDISTRGASIENQDYCRVCRASIWIQRPWSKKVIRRQVSLLEGVIVWYSFCLDNDSF